MFYVVIDTQVDFMLPNGKLYVPDAEKLIPDIMSFLSSIDKSDTVLFTQDYHVRESYNKSEEAKLFPLHCEALTVGQENVIPPGIVPCKTYVLNKDVFSMWETEDYSHIVESLFFPEGAEVYSRSKFIDDMRDLHNNQVTVFGVAGDYCVLQAVQGFLERGFEVTIMPRLCQGISKNINQALDENLLEQVTVK